MNPTRRRFLVAAPALLLSTRAMAIEASFADYRRKLDEQWRQYQQEQDAKWQQSKELKNTEFNQFSQNLDEQFRLFKDELDRVQQEFAANIKQSWGQTDTRLPTVKQWVDYNQALTRRRILDFDHGKLTVEYLASEGESEASALNQLDRAIAEAAQDNEADLARVDTVIQQARQELVRKQQMGLPAEPPSIAAPKQPILKEILPPAKQRKATPERVEKSEVVGTDGQARTKYRIVIPFSKGYFAKLAARYAEPVLQNAKRQQLPPSLILATIEVESAFNPRARSPAPAYGLMQLVPRSGARDAYRHLYNEDRLLEPEYLCQPNNNIELGAAYHYMLDHIYLKRIDKALNRRYCAIAAYNTGPGNVARAFQNGTNLSTAIQSINRFQPERLFDHLCKNLPYEETRGYLKKVHKAQQNYLAWDKA